LVFEDDVLADDQAQRIDGSNNEDPFRYTELLTLHDQTCVQPQADKGVGEDEEDPF
jgi:hypothetical protein